MVFGTAALALGGHLMKRAYKWAKHNPQAIGKGINTLAKMVYPKHQGLGKFIRGSAQVAKALSNKDSYINKMASAALTNDSPTQERSISTTPTSSSTAIHRPVAKKRYL